VSDHGQTERPRGRRSVPWRFASVSLAAISFLGQHVWLSHRFPDAYVAIVLVVVGFAWLISTLMAIRRHGVSAAWTLLGAVFATPAWFIFMILGACGFFGRCL